MKNNLFILSIIVVSIYGMESDIQNHNVDAVSIYVRDNKLSYCDHVRYLDLAEHSILKAYKELELYTSGIKKVYEPADFVEILGITGTLFCIVGIACDDVKGPWYKACVASLGATILGSILNTGLRGKIIQKCENNYANALAIKQLIYQADVITR